MYLQNLLENIFDDTNTISITLKRVSKRSSFRYRFQEHLLIHIFNVGSDSQWVITALRDTLNSKLAIVRLVTSVTNPLYFPNIIFLELCFELFLM
jgi:hypothetical protein